MKKQMIRLVFLGAILFTASFSASAQIYVKIRPTFTVVPQPPRPSRAHIWVNEEWQNDGGSYRYSGGHWEAPPQRGYYRTQGHWQRSRRGQVWIQGSWRGRGNNHGNRRH